MSKNATLIARNILSSVLDGIVCVVMPRMNFHREYLCLEETLT